MGKAAHGMCAAFLCGYIPSKSGRNKEICGKYVITSTARIPATTKGITFLQIFSIDRFAILQATYRFAPTGGVTIPTAKLLTIKIPNAYLSYPIEVMIGSRIGRKIQKAEFASMKHPAIRKRILISSKIRYLLLVTDIIAADKSAATPEVVRIQARTPAHPIIYMTTEDVIAALRNIFPRSFHLISL